MDLMEIIHQLREERNNLNAIIHSIEQLNRGVLSQISPATPGRRGRRVMTAADRLEVSRRMRAYWATRREEKQHGTAG
jgi:hypothetical protein